jgi:nucleoredoxin
MDLRRVNATRSPHRRPTRVRAPARALLGVGWLCGALALSCGDSTAEPPPPPPPPPASLSALFGQTLFRADGSAVGMEALEGKAIIAIYFGAAGCPACTAFTPLLVNAYDELRQAGRSFEVVYVSFDGSAEIMYQYMLDARMQWLAMPWGGSQSAALTQRYGVRWIPTLVIIDGAGKTVSLTGREEVSSRGAAAYDDWLTRSGDG